MNHIRSQLLSQTSQRCTLALTFSFFSVLCSGCHELSTYRVDNSPVHGTLPMAAMSHAGYCETQWRSLSETTELTTSVSNYSTLPSIRQPHVLRAQPSREPIVPGYPQSIESLPTPYEPLELLLPTSKHSPLDRELSPQGQPGSSETSTMDLRRVPVISAADYRRAKDRTKGVVDPAVVPATYQLRDHDRSGQISYLLESEGNQLEVLEPELVEPKVIERESLEFDYYR